MSIIQCDTRRGRTGEQKIELARGLTDDVHEVVGIARDRVSVYIRDLPCPYTFEGGQTSTEYQPGPGGADVARQEEIRRRRSARGELD